LHLGVPGVPGTVSLVELWRHPLGGPEQVAKRCFDIVAALMALLLLAPLLLAIAALIRLETPGAVLFRQWRFGLGSVPFQCCKFRTMHAHRGDPTGEQRTAARDPRVTPLGRFLRRASLDELPQLINVLQGDMSLVGPRPHPLHMRVEGAYYFEAVENYRLRHRVKPGITGWAQINGSRGEVATLAQARRRVMLDIEYVRTWSFATDLRIVLRTIFGGFITRAD
jgi:polysaccharide biosynthesis protein PslA